MTSIKAPTVAIQAIDRDIQLYQQHLNALQVARKALTGASGGSSVKRGRKSGTTSRTEIVTEILQASKTPMTVNDIMVELTAKGHSAPSSSVAALLPYLKNKGVAKTIERGKWVAVSAKTKVAAVASDQKAA